MVWTTLYFMHQRDSWYNRLVQLRLESGGHGGHAAYCEEKMAQWEEYARVAAFQFRSANPEVQDVWRPLVTPS